MASASETDKELKEGEDNKPPATDQYVYGEGYKTDYDTKIQLVNLQHALNFQEPHGVMTAEFSDLLKEQVIELLDKHGDALLEKDADGKSTLIRTNVDTNTDPEKAPSIETRLYKLERTADNYTIYELDNEGKPKGDGKELNFFEKVSPALVELAANLTHMQQDIVAENGWSADDLLRLEEIEKERAQEIEKALPALGLDEDTAVALTEAVSTWKFGEAQFKRSELYQKAKTQAKDPAQLDEFLLVMNRLALDAQAHHAGYEEFKADHIKFDSLHQWLHFAAGNGPLLAAQYNSVREGQRLNDNIFSHHVYNSINYMPADSAIRLSNLIDERYEKQTAELKAYFGKDDKILLTKNEVLEYARDRFDIYAIQTLSQGKVTLAEGADKEAIKKFIEDNQDILKNVTQAMSGNYRPNGEDQPPVWFVPYEKDFQLVYEGFAKPDLNDPDFRAVAEKLIERDPPDITYALRTCTKAELADLYEAGKHLLKDDPDNIREAVKRNGYRLGYGALEASKFADQMIENINKDPQPDLGTMHPRDQELYVAAILRKFRPELMENKSYARIVSNYTAAREDNFLDRHRAGEPVVDENGRLKLDENGNTQWNGGFNGRYGGQNFDELNNHHFRVDGRDFASKYGQDVADMFYDVNGKRNYNLDIKEVLNKIAETDPSKAEQLRNDILEAPHSSAWHYYMILRINVYRDNREKFAQIEIDKELIRKQDAAAKTEQAGPGGGIPKGEGGEGGVNVNANGDNKLNADGLPDLGINSTPTAESDASLVKPLAGLAAIRGADKLFNRKAATVIAEGAPQPEMPRTNPAAKVNFQNDLMVNNPAPTNKFPLPLDQADPTGRMRIEWQKQMDAAKNMPADRLLPAGHQPPSMADKIRHENNLMGEDARKSAQKLDDLSNTKYTFEKGPTTQLERMQDAWRSSIGAELADRIELKQPGRLSRLFTGLAKGGQVLGKGAAFVTKYSGLLTVVGLGAGAAIGNAEIEQCKENLKDIPDSLFRNPGDKLKIQEELDSIYTQFLLESTVGTVVNEFLIRSNINDVIEKYDIDPVTAGMIMPDLLINIFEGDELEPAQLKRLHDNFNAAKLENVYEGILNENPNFPKTWNIKVGEKTHSIPIGYALRDEKLADEIFDKHVFKERVKEGPRNQPKTYYHEDMKKTYEQILKINEMAGMAMYMQEEHVQAGGQPYQPEAQAAAVSSRESDPVVSGEFNEKGAEQQLATASPSIQTTHQDIQRAEQNPASGSRPLTS